MTVLPALALWPAQLPVPVHDRGEVERVTREVLSRREFYEPKPSWFTSLRERVIDELARLISRILDGANGSPLGWLAIAIVVAAIVLLGVRFGRTVSRDREQPLVVTTTRRRSPTDWRAEAAVHEAAGEWRQALRCHYRALVAELATRGLVEEIPGRTAGEYRAEVTRNVPRAAADFGGATELFELAWYGNRPTGPEETRRLEGLAGHVLEVVR